MLWYRVQFSLHLSCRDPNKFDNFFVYLSLHHGLDVHHKKGNNFISMVIKLFISKA